MLWIGSSRSFAPIGVNGESLYHLKRTPDSQHVDVSVDSRLADRVADNLFRAQKFQGTESESLLTGRVYGITSSNGQGRDGNLFVVSLSDDAIYIISPADP